MKNSTDNSPASCSVKNRSKIKEILDRQVHKVRKGTFTCPFCKETCTGLAAFGAHLRDHCT